MDKKKKCIVCSEVGSAVTNHCAGGLSKTLYLALYCIASLRRLNELLGQRNLKKKLSGLGGGGGGEPAFICNNSISSRRRNNGSNNGI